MRFTFKKYRDGGEYALETSNDGTQVVSELLGTRQPGKRISVFAMVLGDDSADGAAAMVEALAFLKHELAKRAEMLSKSLVAK